MRELFSRSETLMSTLFYDKFTSQPQAISRVIFNLPLRLHFMLLRCCLPENIYKQI